jgi:hypothetical protein
MKQRAIVCRLTLWSMGIGTSISFVNMRENREAMLLWTTSSYLQGRESTLVRRKRDPGER